MQRDGNSTSRAALAFGAIFFFIFAAQAKAVTRPSLAAPANDATVQALPVLRCGAVAGAAKYEVQVSSDSGFDSVVSAGDFFTRDTRATLKRALPNGRLYWRVRTSMRAAPSRRGPPRGASSRPGRRRLQPSRPPTARRSPIR